MSPPAIVKIDTHPNKQTLLLAIYFLVGNFATLFLFREFFQADQGLHIRATWFASKYSFTE